jgi:hypothetical protein
VLLLRAKRLAAGGSCCSCKRRLQVWLLLLPPPPLLLLASMCSCAPAGSIRRDNQRYDGIALCEQAKAALQVAAALREVRLSTPFSQMLIPAIFQVLLDECEANNSGLAQQLLQLRSELAAIAKL